MTQPFKMRETIFLPDLDKRFPDHTWVFWASPTWETVLALGFQGDTDSETKETVYFVAVSECVFDTGESGVDWSTPEKVRETFYSDIPQLELLGGIMGCYLKHILDKRDERLKKTLARSNSTDTGKSKSLAASTSPT